MQRPQSMNRHVAELRLVLMCGLAATTMLHAPARAQERGASPMRQVKVLPLPGVKGRVDQFTIDKQQKRIMFSCPDDNTVQIVDAFDGNPIYQIRGLSQPRGTF